MVNTINSSDEGKAKNENGDNMGDLGFNSMIDNIVNNPPIGENKTVDAGGMDNVSVPLNILDYDLDLPTIEIIGSHCSEGDMSEIKVMPSGNTIFASISWGSGNGYIDYKVRDDKGNQSGTYRVDINNLGA